MFRWLVNLGFLALPIGVTIGILLGLQAQRDSSGGPPLFHKPDGAPPINNKITYVESCEKAFGIHPLSKGQKFTLNPNQWGVKSADPSGMCMNVTTFNNQTYATPYTAPQWSIWWRYKPVAGTGNNVHAFPNIKVDDVFPVAVKDVSRIDLDMQWVMRMDNDTGSTDEAQLRASTVNSNVAVDMFMDSDRAKAGDSTRARFEVMVWFAAFGDSAKTVGEDDPMVASYNFNGTTFNLYAGQNSNSQVVLTWKAQATTNDFHGDLRPFIDEIIRLGNSTYISNDDYLGYLSFGSEAYSASKTVTFHVPLLAIQVETAS